MKTPARRSWSRRRRAGRAARRWRGSPRARTATNAASWPRRQLRLTDNYNLLDLDGLSALSTVGDSLTLSLQPDLIDVTGLHGLTAILGDLLITDNTSLSEADIEALIEAIGEENISGEITVSDNGE